MQATEAKAWSDGRKACSVHSLPLLHGLRQSSEETVSDILERSTSEQSTITASTATKLSSSVVYRLKADARMFSYVKFCEPDTDEKNRWIRRVFFSMYPPCPVDSLREETHFNLSNCVVAADNFSMNSTELGCLPNDCCEQSDGCASIGIPAPTFCAIQEKVEEEAGKDRVLWKAQYVPPRGIVWVTAKLHKYDFSLYCREEEILQPVNFFRGQDKDLIADIQAELHLLWKSDHLPAPYQYEAKFELSQVDIKAHGNFREYTFAVMR